MARPHRPDVPVLTGNVEPPDSAAPPRLPGAVVVGTRPWPHMNELPPTPIPRSFALTPLLFGGVFPGSETPAVAEEKLRALLDAGITRFLDLTEPGEATRTGPLVSYEAMLHELAAAHPRRPEVRRVGIPVPDLTVASDAAIVEALAHIDAALDGGESMYVHCWGGKGRTGTVLGCHLARRLGVDALERLNAIRTPQMCDPGTRSRSPRPRRSAGGSRPGRSTPTGRDLGACHRRHRAPFGPVAATVRELVERFQANVERLVLGEPVHDGTPIVDLKPVLGDER